MRDEGGCCCGGGEAEPRRLGVNRGEAGRLSSSSKAEGSWLGSGGGEEQGVMASSSSVKELRRVVVLVVVVAVVLVVGCRLGRLAGRCGVGMTMCAMVVICMYMSGAWYDVNLVRETGAAEAVWFIPR